MKGHIEARIIENSSKRGGAETSIEVDDAAHLLECLHAGTVIAELPPVPREIALRLLDRLLLGANTHGVWETASPDAMVSEAAEEGLDAAIYLVRRLIALEEGGGNGD